MSAAAAVIRTPVAAGGFAPPSKMRRPIAVPPLEVMISTLVRSSPATLIGSEAVSAPPPSPPAMEVRNIIVSPSPDVMKRIEVTFSV